MAEEKGFFRRLVSGLTKTRDNIVSGMDSIFHGFSHIDEDFYEELEEVLIMGDLGVAATEDILDDLRAKVKEQQARRLEREAKVKARAEERARQKAERDAGRSESSK